MRGALFTMIAVAALAGASAALGARHVPIKQTTYTIVHVQKGCHVWLVNGKRVAASRVHLARGGTIRFINNDVDGHKLIRLAGPAKLNLPALGMNGRATVRFSKAGSYVLGTKVFEMKGMPEMETVGRDNVLRLTVVVA
jgi:plastocyanin